jgi:hypothetical protein
VFPEGPAVDLQFPHPGPQRVGVDPQKARRPVGTLDASMRREKGRFDVTSNHEIQRLDRRRARGFDRPQRR